MKKVVRETRLPHVMVVLPPNSEKSDAEAKAESLIREGLGIDNFEIMLVELDSEGQLQTPIGVVDGKRFRVVFRQTSGVVVYVHPDYDKIVNR